MEENSKLNVISSAFNETTNPIEPQPVDSPRTLSNHPKETVREKSKRLIDRYPDWDDLDIMDALFVMVVFANDRMGIPQELPKPKEKEFIPY